MKRVKIENGKAAGTKNKFADVFIKSANVSENISEQSAKNKKYSQSAYSSFISLWRASFARKFATGIEAVYN